MKFLKFIRPYKFDYLTLQWKRHTKIEVTFGILILIIATLSVLLYNSEMSKTKIRITKADELIVINEYMKFSKENLIREIKNHHLKFPWIILAQAVHETNYHDKDFNSPLFRNNNNLFGMKESGSRPRAHSDWDGPFFEDGTRYAFYDRWQLSVIDMGYYQCRVLREVSTEDQYWQYLDAKYAEDPLYIEKVKPLAEKFKKEINWDE